MEEERSLPVDKVIGCVAACICVSDMKYVMEQRDGLINVLLYAFSPTFPWTGSVLRKLFSHSLQFESHAT